MSVDGSAATVAKAFETGQKPGLILKTVQADWRELNRSIDGKYDAIIWWLPCGITTYHGSIHLRRLDRPLSQTSEEGVQWVP